MSNDEKISKSINSHGGRRLRAGRPLGSLNKLSRPLKEAAALHTEDCLAVLVQLRDHAESEQVRLAAAMALLDRGHGRPRQELDLNKSEGLTVVIERWPPVNRPQSGPVMIESHPSDTQEPVGT
ncbi:MAG: hypothetical protein Nkreftii_004176 [Candidatus Nitrospira kreftii]|uniref:Uncharacterized protein n=1 Tax=Candidatus Nitrospira kreftii TaxID=2652173 RepID=A0A7S8FIJ6_9BACT|nr:MAG: hypothetical protein Nkreftii_004176 [Candidatus Nitrospira kreftii]